MHEVLETCLVRSAETLSLIYSISYISDLYGIELILTSFKLYSINYLFNSGFELFLASGN